MNRTSKTITLILLIATGSLFANIGADATPPGDSSESSNGKLAAETKAAPLPSVVEARGRARLLHETIQATLQVVHHEYYREDEKLPIPARTFKKVFRELADNWCQRVGGNWGDRTSIELFSRSLKCWPSSLVFAVQSVAS